MPGDQETQPVNQLAFSVPCLVVIQRCEDNRDDFEHGSRKGLNQSKFPSVPIEGKSLRGHGV